MSDSQVPGTDEPTPHTDILAEAAGDTTAAAPGAKSAAAQSSGPAPAEEVSALRRILHEILSGSAVMSVLAVVLALVSGAVLIVVTNPKVQAAAGYFFSRPGDTFSAMWDAAFGAYAALFRGSIYNYLRPDFFSAIKPVFDTLAYATPLILAGLGVALAFRVGLFNIGGRGQMLMASAGAGYVAFTWQLPVGLHVIVALIVGVAAGAIWGGIVGLLKARTGAHEVIVTIMLNYVAYWLISYLLKTPLLQAPGSINPKTPATPASAQFPEIPLGFTSLNSGLILAVAATLLVWWLLERSSLGFQFRAVGENPSAARVAGINVNRMFVYTMLISGALVGAAGVTQVLENTTSGFGAGIDAGIGFDAITVALLGRARPWGVLGAGILFGALKAGSFTMQASQGVPIEIVLVVQSLIVLFIAAPPLVRAVFRLPAPGSKPRISTRKTEAAK